MKWLRRIFGASQASADDALRGIQEKFAHFVALLERNNLGLKAISDMEEKAQGEYLFDYPYIQTTLNQIREAVQGVIEHMIAMGGESYEPLRERYAEIDAQIDQLLPGNKPIQEDQLTIRFRRLGREKVGSVGGKNAQLGEMRGKLKLPVPPGFATTAWAYKHFIDSGDLQARITRRLRSLDIKSHDELERVSREIQQMVLSSPVPEDLAKRIRRSAEALRERAAWGRFAMRSSAVGEDSQFSFAGQYATFLNVHSDEIVDVYRRVLASKFTPKAIYYLLSHDLHESDLAMSVGCMVMVDVRSAGVVYTRNPVDPADKCLRVNSVFGLGKYLVDGILTPDVFRVDSSDGTLVESWVARKPVRLMMRPEGGTVEEPVPDEMQMHASLDAEEIRRLAEVAVQIAKHYGEPQDIEWAIDREGQLWLLQTRPLRTLSPVAAKDMPDVSSLEVLSTGGQTVCPGAGAGRVCHVDFSGDLGRVPAGAVLVAPSPFPGLVTVMDRIHALVTEVGGVASHMATMAREYGIPALTGVEGAMALPANEPITVDATGATIYAGSHSAIVEARYPEPELFDDMPIFDLLKKVLEAVAPLNLLHPADEGFTMANCRTFHDINRFAHQKAMEEMFTSARNMEHKDQIGLRLKSAIPLRVNIIYIDRAPDETAEGRWVAEDELASKPMRAFWDGIKQEGWPQQTPPVDAKGILSVMATDLAGGARLQFTENSFAILSKEYMILSLGMGYHFTTVEAMCTDEAAKNYIRMQHKDGGSSFDRRVRRVRLLETVLSLMRFESSSVGDSLDAEVTYSRPNRILDKLRLLGRLTMMTKQLDMALSNDAIARWYTDDIVKRLGLSQD